MIDKNLNQGMVSHLVFVLALRIHTREGSMKNKRVQNGCHLEMEYLDLNLYEEGKFWTFAMLSSSSLSSSSFIVRFPCDAQVGRYPPIRLLQLVLSNAKKSSLFKTLRL